mgnify:CR=1 FL=1
MDRLKQMRSSLLHSSHSDLHSNMDRLKRAADALDPAHYLHLHSNMDRLKQYFFIFISIVDS